MTARVWKSSCAALAIVGCVAGWPSSGCLLPSYEIADGASGGEGGSGGGGGLGGGGGGGDACVEALPTCTTNQDDNCGECGRSCEGLTACVDDQCPPTEHVAGDAWFVHYALDVLAWTEGDALAGVGPGGIYWYRLGEAAISSFALSNSAPRGLWMDDVNLLWTNSDFNGQVLRSRWPAGTPETLFQGFGEPGGVAASDDFVFFGVGGYAGTIQRGPYDGVAVSDASDFVVDVGHPEAVAVQGAYVYWITLGVPVSDAPAGVYRRELSGGAVETLYEENDELEMAGLAVDDTHAYWASKLGVMRVTLDPPRTQELVSDQAASRGVVVDDQAAYWTEPDQGRIYKRRKLCDGLGPPVLLFDAGDAGVSAGLAVGSGRVFFSSGGVMLSVPR